MKKKIIGTFMIISLLASFLTGCGASSTSTDQTSVSMQQMVTDKGNYQVALVMDVGILNDKSFNQGTWEGLQEYCDEHDLSYKYYKSTDNSTEGFQSTIEEAIESGAEVVVCPGFLFETPVYTMQQKYPDVKFILIDGEPHNEDYSEYLTTENTMPILYQEEQSGFFAGYAAVKDGNTELGYMGGISLPAVMRYGYGYLAGAEFAAEEDGIANVHIKYTYTGSFEATDEAQALASQWYADGTQVIFGCGGSVGNSVMLAAEESQDGKVIGVDVDQSYESITVITSAMKMLSNSVYDAIDSVYNDSFVGGKTTIFDIKNNGVGIAMENSRFNTFSQEAYDKIYGDVLSGSVNVQVDIEKTPQEQGFEHLTIDEITM